MWRKLWFNDKVEGAIRQIIASGSAYIDHDTGLIKPSKKQMSYDGNWLFSGYTTSLRDCYLWHQIMFNHFNIVPEFCHQRCYKVVVKVRNFLEAMQFYGLMYSSGCLRAECCPIHGKVGMDERSYSDAPFNGFVYCDGLMQGLEKYDIIREMIDKHMPDGSNIQVILKRSCTEFERAYGPTNSKFWAEMPQEHLELQHRLEDIFDGVWSSSIQPDWLKNKIIYKLARWANAHGDKSWIDYFGSGDFMTMKAVTYHHLAESYSPKIEGDKENGSS